VPTPTLPPPTPATVEAMIPPSGGPITCETIPSLCTLPFGIGSGGKWDSRPYFQQSFQTIEDVASVGVDTTDHVIVNEGGFNLFVDTSPAAFTGAILNTAAQQGKTLYFIKIWHGYVPLIGILGIQIAGFDIYRILFIAEK
jgi:hypothetical protein